jgi:hypothetical protein
MNTTNETVKVNGSVFCAECYAEVSKAKNANEETKFLAYEFLHYEWNHLTEAQRAELVAA